VGAITSKRRTMYEPTLEELYELKEAMGLAIGQFSQSPVGSITLKDVPGGRATINKIIEIVAGPATMIVTYPAATSGPGSVAAHGYKIELYGNEGTPEDILVAVFDNEPLLDFPKYLKALADWSIAYALPTYDCYYFTTGSVVAISSGWTEYNKHEAEAGGAVCVLAGSPMPHIPYVPPPAPDASNDPNLQAEQLYANKFMLGNKVLAAYSPLYEGYFYKATNDTSTTYSGFREKLDFEAEYELEVPEEEPDPAGGFPPSTDEGEAQDPDKKPKKNK
jgi:hypothetical protein